VKHFASRGASGPPSTLLPEDDPRVEMRIGRVQQQQSLNVFYFGGFAP